MINGAWNVQMEPGTSNGNWDVQMEPGTSKWSLGSLNANPGGVTVVEIFFMLMGWGFP